ncbi:Oligopeptide transport ATP-binding protein OppD [Caloramator mitchellensis]|uniref:Oligopeptide transport ATP-binding protein OppD n=2 Tax=Caloramator mitchellensis TaxID=908809 RepID=A0A0R3JUR7_CALMK|nr:ABC transporter ATP-binding protein [Caloramator mitchellensis]KRQ87318.1 Oligopeptide transport ATP-binding protein OppD [Caloramator mitchellensis]
MGKMLEVRNLKTYFYTEDGVVPAVDGVDFYIKHGETLGLVGESGCGKSVTSLSILRLVPPVQAKILEESEIIFEGTNLLELPIKDMRKLRGNKISMIFQEPMTSLNPVFKIGYQISEVLMLHQKMDKHTAWEKSIELLRKVNIPSPEKVVNEYPHTLSGGMRQRVMIAMALACNPKLLIADEPTTALDVTVQAQILELMNELKKEFNAAVMLITHNLGVVAETCDRIVVMYAGKIVEEGTVHDIFENPLHPYTKGLLNSIPSVEGKKGKLESIPGVVPNPLNMPKGCRFSPRCKYAKEICYKNEPNIKRFSEDRAVRCFIYEDGEKNE